MYHDSITSAKAIGRSRLYSQLNNRPLTLWRKHKDSLAQLVAVFSSVSVLSYWASYHVQPGLYMFAVQLIIWSFGSMAFNELIGGIMDSVNDFLTSHTDRWTDELILDKFI